VNIPRDLLALILMNSLPRSFENFRCAMESRDVLPDLETLRIKIVKEFEARKDGMSDVTSKAMFAKRCNEKRRGVNRKSDDSSKDGDRTKRDRAKLKCYRCNKTGHFAKDCKVQKKEKVSTEADLAEHTGLCTSFDALSAGNGSVIKAWCLDNGCTTHMSNGEGNFQEAQDSYRGNVNLADKKTSVPVRGKGHVRVLANVEGRAKQFRVEDVLRVPELRANLLSVGKITDRGYRVIFDNVKAVVTDKENQTILTAYRKDGLYYLREATSNPSFEANLAGNIKSADSVEMWHRKMGHLNVHDLVKCHRDNSVRGMNLKVRQILLRVKSVLAER